MMDTPQLRQDAADNQQKHEDFRAKIRELYRNKDHEGDGPLIEVLRNAPSAPAENAALISRLAEAVVYLDMRLTDLEAHVETL